MTLVDSFSVRQSASGSPPSPTIDAQYDHVTTSVDTQAIPPRVTSTSHRIHFRTETAVPKIGLMMVGWGGNNGTTVTGAILANKHNLTWSTKEQRHNKPNYLGSLLLSSTTRLGQDAAYPDRDVYLPLHNLLPMVHPSDLHVTGWDISAMDLAAGMARAAVFDYDLQVQLTPYMKSLSPLPSIYYPEFIASNQQTRADNVLPGDDKSVHLTQIREHIQQFRARHSLDSVIVMWTATTERCSPIIPRVNDSADHLLHSISKSHPSVSPSTVFAVASILENCAFINGSPQNTLVPGCVQLAERHNVFVGGDDFKSGQTKLKSVLVDFLVGAGIRPRSIVSYNHLGNNDGHNLSQPKQFRSKQVSKSNVIDDIIYGNPILYPDGSGSPDHEVVIKYIPAVGDSKRALDEYESDIFMNGRNTMVIHNTCEDSLLAAPLILDLVMLCELCQRMWYKVGDEQEYRKLHPVLSLLSYWLKAPVVPDGAPVVNALFKQRACIENLLRVCAGLPVETNLRLEHRTTIGLAGWGQAGDGMQNGRQHS